MEKIISIGIIGGGEGGYEILELFSKSSSIDIKYLVDLNKNAIAMKPAINLGISTYTDLLVANNHHNVKFIIEATGSSEVIEIINQRKQKGTEVISSNVALLLMNVLSDNRNKTNQQVLSNIIDIKTKIATNTTQAGEALKNIYKINKDMDLLAVNATIEAAHAKKYGKGFSIVASEIKKTVKKMTGLANIIKTVNNEITNMSHQIEALLNKLQ